jgi:signal transduction histidine kinase
MPLVRIFTPGAQPQPFDMRQSWIFTVLALNPDYVKNELLPGLLKSNFGVDGDYHVAVVKHGSPPELLYRSDGDVGLFDPTLADALSPLFQFRLEPPHGDAQPGTFMVISERQQGQPRRDDSEPQQARSFVTVATPQGESARTEDPARPAPAGVEPSRRWPALMGTISMELFGPGTTREMATRIRIPVAGEYYLLLRHRAGSVDAAVAKARTRNLVISSGILLLLGVSLVLIVVSTQRAQKLAARQMEFVAAVSHELRTPLAVIRTAGQNLADGVVDRSAQARKYGALIESEGRRLTELVEEALAFAAQESGHAARDHGPVDAASLVAAAVASSSGLAAPDEVTIEQDVEKDLPPVVGDEQAIRRALQNLIVNAFKHGAEGRSVRVSARIVRVRKRHEMEISVSDRGPGIDPADLPHLFEPFYRGRRAVENRIHGNGLGLALVRRVAEAHGGRVSVQSKPGDGACFTLHLPIAEAPRPAAPSASVSQEPADTGLARIGMP